MPPIGDSIPHGWQEIIAPEGIPVLVRDPNARRRQARVAAAVAVLVGAVALALIKKTTENQNLIAITVMACAAAAGLTWAALWLGRGRMEWRLGSETVTLRRRYGTQVRDLFEARAIELSQNRDSDGDRWYVLEALAHGPEERRNRRRIVQTMRDPAVPRRLGAWLAARTDVPFRDLTGPAGDAVRAAEIARLRALLPPTGVLGRLLGRLMDRVEAGRPPA